MGSEFDPMARLGMITMETLIFRVSQAYDHTLLTNAMHIPHGHGYMRINIGISYASSPTPNIAITKPYRDWLFDIEILIFMVHANNVN